MMTSSSLEILRPGPWKPGSWGVENGGEPRGFGSPGLGQQEAGDNGAEGRDRERGGRRGVSPCPVPQSHVWWYQPLLLLSFDPRILMC